MTYNYGKRFEDVVREAFEKVPGVSIDRLHDQTTGFKGSTNICDFIVYNQLIISLKIYWIKFFSISIIIPSYKFTLSNFHHRLHLLYYYLRYSLKEYR